MAKNKIGFDNLNVKKDDQDFLDYNVDESYETYQRIEEVTDETIEKNLDNYEGEANNLISNEEIDHIQEGLPADDSLKLMLIDIGKTPLLNREEEVELAKKVMQGNMIAREKLILANMRLVVSIAKKYINCSLPLEDLIEDGVIGLITATEKFDYTKGYKFSTYATPWIKQSISRSIANKINNVRIPIHMQELIRKVAEGEEKLTQDLGRKPTDEEIAELLGMTHEKVRDIKKYKIITISIETPIDESTRTIGENIVDNNTPSPYDSTSEIETKEQIKSSLKILSNIEAKVIIMRHGLNDNECLPYSEIAKTLKFTVARVRQIEVSALRKIRRLKEDK